MFGNYVNNQLHSVEGKNSAAIDAAQSHLLNRLLADDEDEVEQVYSDPAALFN